MSLQVVSPKVAVHQVTGTDDNGQPTAVEHVFLRGAILPDWVSPYQQFVLTQTGMARQVGDFPDASLHAPEEAPAPVMMPEHSPQAVGLQGPTVVTEQVTGQDAAAPGGHVPDGELPDDNATKPVWEDVAAKRYGMSRSAAESMKKADLLAEVKKRHADRKASAAQKAADHQRASDAMAVKDNDDKLPPKFGK